MTLEESFQERTRRRLRCLGLTGALGLIIALVPRAALAAAAAPSAQTLSATGITLRGATLHATANPNGAHTTVRFQFGPTASYGSQTRSQDIGAGGGPVAVSAHIAGIQPGALYHFQVLTQNLGGQTKGGDRTFRADDPKFNGSYRVRLKVMRGGRAFGQAPGTTSHRLYRFSARCSGDGCPAVALTRAGRSGTFRSVLKRQVDGSYTGVEHVQGFCDNGKRFHSRDRVTVEQTQLHGRIATAIMGRLTLRVRGCVNGTEIADLTGSRVA